MDPPAVGTLAEAASGASTDGPLAMGLVGVILLVTFLFIAFDWLHKTEAALLGAVAAVATGLVLGVFDGDVFHVEKPYHAVYRAIEHDLDVIGVIVGTSILVTVASDSGLFHFLAIKLLKATHGDPRKMLTAVTVATVGFVTFLTIAPGVLIMTSLVLVITRALGDDPRPHILAVAIAANSGAMVTFASGIPTLMIGTAAAIPYVHFLWVSAPLALVSAAVAYGVIRFVYRRSLAERGDAAERAERVAAFDEWADVEDISLFYRSALVLALTIAGFATAQAVGVGLDFIAMAGATAALLISTRSPEEAVKKVKWTIIVFFVGLFVLIGTVQETGLLELLAARLETWSGGDTFLAVTLLVPFCFVTAGLVDNIPVAATMIPVIESMVGGAGGLRAEPLWWSLIAACNLGGNSTPVGSVAAVIALHGLERERGIHVGWGEFLRVGGLVTVAQIVLVVGYIAAFASLGWFPSLSH